MTQRELFDKLQTEITDQLSDVKLDLETVIVQESHATIDQLIMETQIIRDVVGIQDSCSRLNILTLL